MTSPSTTRPRRKRPVTAHPAFAAMLGVWGAAIGALAVVVLPDRLIEAAITAAGSDVLLSHARLALGGALGALLGLFCFMIGQLAGRGHRAASAARDADGPDLIDPAADLGIASLDAPLGFTQDAPTSEEDGPADDDTWLPAFLGEVQDEPTCFEEASALAMASAAPDPAPPPRELDLSAFADMPGRNAVWVEEAVSATAEPSPPAPKPAPTALARLRAVPPTQLSLCEMVERLAAALQEYQAAHGDDAASVDDSPQDREALLDEALGALGRVTSRGRAEQEPANAGPAFRAAAWGSQQQGQTAQGAA